MSVTHTGPASPVFNVCGARATIWAACAPADATISWCRKIFRLFDDTIFMSLSRTFRSVSYSSGVFFAVAIFLKWSCVFAWESILGAQWRNHPATLSREVKAEAAILKKQPTASWARSSIHARRRLWFSETTTKGRVLVVRCQFIYPVTINQMFQLPLKLILPRMVVGGTRLRCRLPFIDRIETQEADHTTITSAAIADI